MLASSCHKQQPACGVSVLKATYHRLHINFLTKLGAKLKLEKNSMLHRCHGLSRSFRTALKSRVRRNTLRFDILETSFCVLKKKRQNYEHLHTSLHTHTRIYTHVELYVNCRRTMRPSYAIHQQTSNIKQLTRLSQLSRSRSLRPSPGPVFKNQFRVVCGRCPNLLTASICLMYIHIHSYKQVHICLIFFYLIPDFSSNFISCLLDFLTFVFVRCH